MQGISSAELRPVCQGDTSSPAQESHNIVNGTRRNCDPTDVDLNVDERLSWKPKQSADATYYMTHGDMFPYNLMLSLETLEVVAAIDWEHSGFFPLEFQQWCDTREKRVLLCRNEELIRNLVAMIEQ